MFADLLRPNIPADIFLRPAAMPEAAILARCVAAFAADAATARSPLAIVPNTDLLALLRRATFASMLE